MTAASKLPALLRRKTVWIAAGGGVAAIAIVVALVGVFSGGPGPGREGGKTARVQRGPLPVTVTESGEVEADRSTVIQNDLRWAVIIKSVVPDGTVVKKGEKVIEFECKELSDAIETGKLEVSAAETAYTKVKQDLELQTKELAHKVGQAQRDLQDAHDDQKRYVEGDLPVLRWEKQTAIDVAKRQLNIVRDTLEFMMGANKDPSLNKPYSDRDIETKQLEADQQENALKKAEKKKEVLDKYIAPREIRKGEFTVVQKQLDLEPRQLEQKTQLAAGEVDLKAKETQLKLRQKALDDVLEDERKLTVLAEKEGLVVYDTGGNPFSQDIVQVAVGQKVGLRQRLMIIPDMSSLQVRTKVYEAVVEKVHEGQEAYVRLDARSDAVLKGKVKKVAPLPDKIGFFDSGVKAYTVIVALDKIPVDLRPKKTAKVELVLARLASVLKAPVAAVFTEQEKTFAYRVRGHSAEKTPIKVGSMNEAEIEICQGLDEGDEVWLTPPGQEKKDESAKAASGVGGASGGGGGK